MICSNYELLTHPEKIQFLGKLCHASQSDSTLFEMAKELIRLGELRGLFDNVKILPDNEPTNTRIS